MIRVKLTEQRKSFASCLSGALETAAPDAISNLKRAAELGSVGDLSSSGRGQEKFMSSLYVKIDSLRLRTPSASAVRPACRSASSKKYESGDSSVTCVEGSPNPFRLRELEYETTQREAGKFVCKAFSLRLVAACSAFPSQAELRSLKPSTGCTPCPLSTRTMRRMETRYFCLPLPSIA